MGVGEEGLLLDFLEPPKLQPGEQFFLPVSAALRALKDVHRVFPGVHLHTMFCNEDLH